MKVFIIWLVLVIAWNYGYPEASPLEDVIVAVVLSLASTLLKSIQNLVNLQKNRYFENMK
tara:strand:- start:106 stop:285 length:180 start_codon:yes stop_codon:yes gene_type:complete